MLLQYHGRDGVRDEGRDSGTARGRNWRLIFPPFPPPPSWPPTPLSLWAGLARARMMKRPSPVLRSRFVRQPSLDILGDEVYRHSFSCRNISRPPVHVYLPLSVVYPSPCPCLCTSLSTFLCPSICVIQDSQTVAEGSGTDRQEDRLVDTAHSFGC